MKERKGMKEGARRVGRKNGEPVAERGARWIQRDTKEERFPESGE